MKQLLPLLSIFLSLLVSPISLSSGIWKPPVDIGLVGGDPQIAIDGNGNAVAIWIASNGNFTKIVSGVLPVGATTWQIIPVTDPSKPSTYASLGLGVNQNGDAVAIWTEILDQNMVESSTLLFGTTSWTPFTLLSTTPNFIPTGPVMAVDGVGNALVAWESFDQNLNGGEGGDVVEVTTLPFNSTSPTAPETLSTYQGFNPAVAVNSAGMGLVVWEGETLDGTEGNIEAAISQGSITNANWQVQVVTSLDSNSFAQDPAAAMDPSGNAVIAWWQPTFPVPVNPTAIIKAATALSGTNTWIQTSSVASALIGPLHPDIELGVDQYGNSVTTWLDFRGGTSMVRGATLPFNTGTWQNVQNISTIGQSATPQSLYVSLPGLSFTVWTESTTNTSQASVLAPGATTWSAPVVLSSIGPSKRGVLSYNPQVSANSVGEAIAIWSLTDNVLHSSYFAPFFVQGPQNVVGSQVKNKFLLQTDYIHKITWTAPLIGAPVQTYAIYRDAGLTDLAGTVSARFPPYVFEDHNRGGRATYTYYIVSIAENGSTSNPAVVTIN